MIFIRMPIFKRKDEQVIIRPFGGYANNDCFYAQARILEDKGILHTEHDGIFRTIRNFYRRMGSDEKKNVAVRISWKSGSEKVVSNREGYIYLNHPHGLGVLPEKTEWVKIFMKIVHPKFDHEIDTEIMRPGKSVEYGVISDIDDTILHTGVASRLKWRLLFNSIAKHPFKRKALTGTSEFYQLLHSGRSSESENPIFYVSNSPWNLYGYLETFLNYRLFPRGPIILRDIGIKPDKRTEEGGKFGRVKEIMEAFPNMQFVLIGDSAEVDTDIYLRLARRYPEQVHSIFIRSVFHKKRTRRVKKLIEENRDINVRLIRSSAEAIDYAKSLRLF
jgi:phosphatidate phosphatase APP1